MNIHIFIILITGFLVMLWLYAAFSKIFDLEHFKQAMSIQVFPKWAGEILVYVLPISELVIAVLLVMPKMRLIGMYSSFFMMFLFTLYIAGAVFKIYARTPCACGGLFARLSWKRHFNLNIILTLIALTGVILLESLN